MGPTPRQTTKEEIAEHFENCYDGDIELKHNNRLVLDQNLRDYDRNEDESYEGIKVNGEVIVMPCTFCGSTFKYLREVTLIEIDVHIDRIKDQLGEDFLDDIGYEDPSMSHYQGRIHSITTNGCTHNYVFQRKTWNGNQVEVKCSKCGDRKTM